MHREVRIHFTNMKQCPMTKRVDFCHVDLEDGWSHEVVDCYPGRGRPAKVTGHGEIDHLVRSSGVGSPLIRGGDWGPSLDLGDAFHLWDIDGGEGEGEGGERMGEAWNPRIPPCHWVLPAKEWHAAWTLEVRLFMQMHCSFQSLELPEVSYLLRQLWINLRQSAISKSTQARI